MAVDVAQRNVLMAVRVGAATSHPRFLCVLMRMMCVGVVVPVLMLQCRVCVLMAVPLHRK